MPFKGKSPKCAVCGHAEIKHLTFTGEAMHKWRCGIAMCDCKKFMPKEGEACR